MQEKINLIIDNNFDNQITDTIQLISLKSVYDKNSISDLYPFGEDTAKCLSMFLDKAESMGFKTKNIDNMAGWAEIGSGDKLYGILCHLDTVPEGSRDKWLSDPFAPVIKDGKIFGRGAIDDKGPTVAALYALKALLDSGEQFNARFRLILGLDEETNFRCVERYLKTEEVPLFSFSPDASFPITNGEKGIIQFSLKRTFIPSAPNMAKLFGLKAGTRYNIVPDDAKAYFSGNTAKIEIVLDDLNLDYIKKSYVEDFLEVKALGTSTHAMNPEKGVNAIQRLFYALSKLDFAPNEMLRWIGTTTNFLKMETNGKSLGIDIKDDVSGELTINTALLHSNGKDLIIGFDIRYPVTVNPKEMEEKVRLVAKKLGTLLRIDTHKAPIYIDENSVEIKSLLTAYEAITGEKGFTRTIGGGTYCKAFPKAVSFGAVFPKEEELAHEENEYANLDSLKKATKIYGRALYLLNNL